jgi:hypothetical protein
MFRHISDSLIYAVYMAFIISLVCKTLLCMMQGSVRGNSIFVQVKQLTLMFGKIYSKIIFVHMLW